MCQGCATATVSKHGKGWRVQIRRLGHAPISKTFPLKGQAWAWADKTERELLTGIFAPVKHTLGDALDKYAKEVSPKKRGKRWEVLRLKADALRKARIASTPIGSVVATDLAKWRDGRLTAVSGATVRREMNLLDSVFEVARKEWKWVATNPLRDVKKPQNPRSRRRRVADAEIAAVCKHLTGPAGKDVAAGFRLGVETGMRAGEMWGLTPDQIDLEKSVAHLTKTKNGDERDVALGPTAMLIIKAMLADKRKSLFLCSMATRDALFRSARDAAKIKNLHFHDSRTEAIYRLSKKLDVLELARQVGHRDIRSLMFYYQSDAAELARKLV